MLLVFTRYIIPWHAFLCQTGSSVCTVNVKATAAAITDQTIGDPSTTTPTLPWETCRRHVKC